MALDYNGSANYISRPKKEWTCHDISELPVESEKLDIPHGSICVLVAKPDYIVYTYDEIAKEWFEI
jgi:hypothetical protein